MVIQDIERYCTTLGCNKKMSIIQENREILDVAESTREGIKKCDDPEGQ